MNLSKNHMNIQNLTHIFEGSVDGNPLNEILYLAEKISPSINLDQIREVHNDLTCFYSGSCPDFQKNTLPYHNLRHSQMVVLASARLFHGLHCNKVLITPETLFKGLLAAYFHDTGMLLQEGDTAHSGTKYMANHEARSILFLSNYVVQKGFDEDMTKDCETIINYTDLKSDPATFGYHTHEIELAGQVIGSADILAQMADRYYLEYLPLLFDEQEAGGISQHNSAQELMEQTEIFYREVVVKRLSTTFSKTSQAMQTHFRERYKIDRNLYMENIDKNISYLKKIISQNNGTDCLEKHLKRIPPTT